MNGNYLLPLVAIFFLVGLKSAQIELPPEIDGNHDRLEIKGFGGYNQGKFTLAEYHGEFKRNESRLSLLDSSYVSNKGTSSFTLRNADSSEILSANCQMKRKVVTIDIVTFDPKKMTYQCDFALDGKMLGARLALGQPKADGFKQKVLAYDLRRGESNIFGEHLLIESIHKYKGSKFQSPSAIGYQLKQGDRLVAAFELTDVNPTLIVARDIDDNLERSVIATALALAVLRDPANSALDD